MSSEPKKYWAFISYSSKDKKWGQWIHKKLETYPIPKELQGTEIFDGSVLGKNLSPVFRDRDELSGSSDLGPAILAALKQSRYLVVLSSKNSAKSQWVNKEIQDFKALEPGNEKHILSLILNGEPNATSNPEFPDSEECFPPALRLPLEPLAGDLRKEGDGKQRGFLKVLAGISQIGFDDLYRRHERAKYRRRLIIASIAGLLVSAFIFLLMNAHSQKMEADNQKLRADSQKMEADSQRMRADKQKMEADAQRIKADAQEQITKLREKEARSNESWSRFHQAQKATEDGQKLKAVAYYGAALESDPHQYEIGIKALYTLASTSSFITLDENREESHLLSNGKQVEEGKTYRVFLSSSPDLEKNLTCVIDSQSIFLIDENETDSPKNLNPASYYNISSFAAASNSRSSAIVAAYGITSEYGNSGGVIVTDSKHLDTTYDLDDYIQSVHFSADGNEFIASSSSRLHHFKRAAHEASPFIKNWSLDLDILLKVDPKFYPKVAGFDNLGNLIFGLLSQDDWQVHGKLICHKMGNSLYPERIPLNAAPFSPPNVTWDADHEMIEVAGIEGTFPEQQSAGISKRFKLNNDQPSPGRGQPIEIYQRSPSKHLWTFTPPIKLDARGTLLDNDTYLLIDVADGGAGLNGFWLYNPRVGFPYQDWLEASAGPFSWSEKDSRIFSFDGIYRDVPDFIQAIDLLGENSPTPLWLPKLCYAAAALEPDETGRLRNIAGKRRKQILQEVQKELDDTAVENRWTQFGKWFLRGELPESKLVSPCSKKLQSEYINPARFKITIIETQQ
ncbi:MAG: TIR domain-containing protein [Luteolibacter sp.]